MLTSYVNHQNSQDQRFSVFFMGKESISYLGPQIWDMIPVEMKNLKTISAFKREVKNWKLENCPCRLCKQYIQNVGFI